MNPFILTALVVSSAQPLSDVQKEQLEFFIPELFPVAGLEVGNTMSLVRETFHQLPVDMAQVTVLFNDVTTIDLQMMADLEEFYRMDPDALTQWAEPLFEARLSNFLKSKIPKRQIKHHIQSIRYWMYLRRVITSAIEDHMTREENRPIAVSLSDCAIPIVDGLTLSSHAHPAYLHAFAMHPVLEECEDECSLPFDVVYNLVGFRINDLFKGL